MPPDEKRTEAPTATPGPTAINTHTSRQPKPDSRCISDLNDDGDKSRDLRLYLDAVYGDTTGNAHIRVGYDPYFNENGKYTHATAVQSHFAWPGEADQMVAEILRERCFGDVFVCPYLMWADKRAKGAAVNHLIAHADVDLGRLDADKVRELGGFAVASGTPGNGHAYLRLAESVTSTQHTALCRALGAHLGAKDSKIADNDVLRPPGTFNLKPTLACEEPAPVYWLVRP